MSELQIVARGSLAEQRLHNHAIWYRRKITEADRAKPLQEPASRDHGLNSPLPRCVVAKEGAPTVSDNRIEPSLLIFIWRDARHNPSHSAASIEDQYALHISAVGATLPSWCSKSAAIGVDRS